MGNKLKYCPVCKQNARALVGRPDANHDMHEYCFDCNYKFKPRATKSK